MPNLINASTSSGLVTSADTSGTIELQSNGTTKLTVSSSGVNIGQMNGGAITAGTAVTLTNQTSVDFTSIPSWVKRITVMFSGVSTSGTSIRLVQLGVSGTPQTTGYTGSYGEYAATLGTSSITQAGFPVLAGASAAYSADGFCTICLLNSNTWTISSTMSSNPARQAVCYGSVALTGTLNMVRVTTVNGTDTFDAGSINILYEG